MGASSSPTTRSFAEKLEDVVGLYLNPPEHALVLCVDEKSQIQALDRTQQEPADLTRPTGTLTHDYKRNGTTTLFAALNVADGTVIDTCMPRHRHQEWIKFLKMIDDCTDPEARTAPDRRQLRHPQASEGPALAEAAPAVPHALHPHQQLLAEHGGTVLPRPDPERASGAAPSAVSPRTDSGDRAVSAGQQPEPQALRLDRQSQGHPGKGQPRPPKAG